MAKIIEAKAIISGQDGLSPILDKLSKKLDQLGKNAKLAPGIEKMSAALEKARGQLAAIDRFKMSMSGIGEARAKFQETQAAVQRAAAAMKAGEGNARELSAAYRRTQADVSAAARAFEQQKTAVMSAKRALAEFGVAGGGVVAHQDRLRAAVDRANAALAKQTRLGGEQSKLARGASAAAGLAGGVVAYRSRDIARKAITGAAEFDIGVRKQRAFTDVTADDQNRILIPQAKRIGQETQFSNLDVVQAQTKSMQGLPAGFAPQLKAEIANGIVENVKNYAMVMESDLATAAEAIRSYLQTTGKDISTKEKALAEANKATNQLVKMAKLGGMSDEDVQQYMKFAAASGTASGLSAESLQALAALARRGGLRGDEAGTFIRSASSKLVAPTKKGLTALNAAGIDYNQFVRMPARLDAGRLEGQFAQDLGVKFTPAVRARLDKLMADPKVLGDRGQFTTAVTGAVSPLFKPTRKGKMAAADRQKIAKSAGDFYKGSAGSVDTEGLLDRLMASDMTLSQMNAFFTDKHGGKFSITQKQRDEYNAIRTEQRKVGDDPDFAKRKADEIMGGLGGALENLKGSFENLTLSLGQANEGLLKFSFDKIGASFDWLSGLSDNGRQAVTALAAIAGLGGGLAFAAKLFNGFGLTSSAVALDGAAGALTAAAARLGVAGAVGAGAAAATPAAAAAAGAGTSAAAIWGTRAAAVLPWAGGLTALIGGGYTIWDANRENGGMTGDQRNARSRGGSINDLRRRSFNETRARFGEAPLGSGNFPELGSSASSGTPAQAELKGSADLNISVKSEATPDFWLKIQTQINNAINAVRIGGVTSTGSSGSLGTSMPEAAPQGAQ